MSGHYSDLSGRGQRPDEHNLPYGSSSRSSYPYVPSYHSHPSSSSYLGTQTAPAPYAPWLARPTSSSRTTSTDTAAVEPALPPTPYTSSRPTSLPSREQVHHYLVSRRKIPQGLQTAWKIDGVPMDAYALFAAVLRAGGSGEVSKRSAWPAVAEDLGFRLSNEYPGPPEMLQRFFMKTLKELEDMWEETKRVQAADDAAGSTSTGFSHRSHAQRDGPMDYTIRDMAPRGGSGSSAVPAAAEPGSVRQRQESARHDYSTGQPSTNSSGWSSAPISPDTLPATLSSYASASTTQSNSGRLTHTAPTYPSSASVPNRLHTQGNKSISPMLPPVSALDFADRTSSYVAQPSGQSARGNDTFSSLYPPDLHVNRQPDTQWSRASASSSYDQFSYTPDMTPPQTSLPNPQALSAQASTSQPAVAMHTDSTRHGEQADVPAAPPKKPRKPRQPKPPADPNAPPKKRGRPRKTAAAPEAPSGNQAHLSTTTLQDDQSRLVGQAAVLSHDQPSTSLSAGQRNSDNLPMTNGTSSAAAPAPTARLPTSINPAALHLAPQTQASTSNSPEAPRPAGQGSQQRPAAPASAQSQGVPSRSGPPTAQSASKSVRPAQTTSNQPSSTSARAPVSQGRPAAANMLSPFSGPAPTAGGLASVIHEAIRSEISSYTAPKVNDFRHLVDSNFLPLPKSSSSETPSGDKVYQYSKRCHEILGAVKASAKQAPGVKVSLDELIFWSKLLAILKANPKVTIPGLPDRPPPALPNSASRQTAVGPSNAASTASTSVAPAGPSSQPANTIAPPVPASGAAMSATPAKKRQRKSNQDYLRDTDGNPILDEDGHMIFIPKLPKPRASFVLDENGNPVLGEDGEPIRKKLGRPPKYYKYVCGPDGLPIRDQYGETYLLKRVFHLPDGSVALNNKGQPIRKKKGPQPVPVFDGNGKIILDQKGFVFHRPFESFLPKLDEEGHVVRDAKGCPVAANKRPEVDWSFHTIDTSANQPPPPKRARFASQNPIFIDDDLDPWEQPATLAAAMESQPAGPSTARPGRPGSSRPEVVLNVARPRWDRNYTAQVPNTSPGPRPHGRTGTSGSTPLTSTTSPLHSLFGSATPKRTINLSGSQSTPQQTPSSASKRKDKGKGRASGSTLVAEQISTPVTRGRKSDPSPATVPRVTRSTAVPEITPVPAKSAKRARPDSSPRALRSVPSVAHALLTRSSSRSLPRVLRRLSAPARPIAPLPTHKPRTPTSRSANSSPLASRRGATTSGPSRLRTSNTRPTRVKIERVSSTELSPRPARQRMVPFIELQSPRKQVKTEVESLSDSASEPSGPIDRARVVLTIGRKKRAKLIKQGFYDAFRDDDSDAETYIRRPGGLRAIKVPLPKSDASRWARPMDPEPVPQRFLVRPGTTMIEPWRTILDPTTILKRVHQLECGWKGCDATLASEWLLARHVEVQNHASRGEFHGGMYGETTLWRCHWKDCDNPCFRSLPDLKQHMTARHISRVLYCPFPDCGLSSPNISHLSRHVMKTHDLPSDIPVPLADLSRHPPRDFEPLAELPGELRVDELATPVVPGTTYRTAHRIEWCRQKVQHGSMAGPDPIIHFEHPPRMLDVVENDMDAPPSDSDDASSADSDDELFTDDPRALDRALGRKRRWELVVLFLPTKRPRPTTAPSSMPDIIEVLDSSPEPEPVLDAIERASASPAPANDPVESVLIAPEDSTAALASSHEPIQAALVEAMQGDVDTALMAAAEDIGQSLENTAEDEIDMAEWDDSAFDQDVTLDSAIFEEELSINDMTTRDPSVYEAGAGEEDDDELDEDDNDHAARLDVLVREEDGSEQSGQQAMLDALDALDTETPADGTPPNVPPAVDVELAQPNQPLSAAQAGVDVDMEEPGTPVDFSTSAVGDTSAQLDEVIVDPSETEQVVVVNPSEVQSGEGSSNDALDKLDEDDLDDLPELEEVPPTPWPM